MNMNIQTMVDIISVFETSPTSTPPHIHLEGLRILRILEETGDVDLKTHLTDLASMLEQEFIGEELEKSAYPYLSNLILKVL